jgi:hypothetical protein
MESLVAETVDFNRRNFVFNMMRCREIRLRSHAQCSLQREGSNPSAGSYEG